MKESGEQLRRQVKHNQDATHAVLKSPFIKKSILQVHVIKQIPSLLKTILIHSSLFLPQALTKPGDRRLQFWMCPACRSHS